MDRVADYSNYIEEILRSYGQYTPAYGDVEVETVIDREQIQRLGQRQVGAGGSGGWPAPAPPGWGDNRRCPAPAAPCCGSPL